MRFSPHFQLFYFNDRFEFFEWKIKRINNADLFSQPPLVIFTKGANISGGHCIIGYWAGDYFQALRHITAPAAPMVRQQSSLIITPEWEYSS